jgi:hypothetical protein
MNVDNCKVGLRKIGIGLNLLINIYLSYSLNRPQLILGANEYVVSLFMIREPPNIFIIAFVNSSLTNYRGMTMINGWTILNNPVYN